MMVSTRATEGHVAVAYSLDRRHLPCPEQRGQIAQRLRLGEPDGLDAIGPLPSRRWSAAKTCQRRSSTW